MRFGIFFWGGWWKSRHPNMRFSSRHLQVLVHQMRIPDSWNVGRGQDELLFLLPKLGSLDPCLLLQSNATMHVILVFQTKHGSFYTAYFWQMCLPKDLDRYLMELLVDGRKPPELHKVERTHNSTGLQCIWLLIWGVERRDIIWTFTSRTMITWVICCVLTDLSSSTPQTHFFQWQLQCTPIVCFFGH